MFFCRFGFGDFSFFREADYGILVVLRVLQTFQLISGTKKLVCLNQVPTLICGSEYSVELPSSMEGRFGLPNTTLIGNQKQ